MSSWIIHAMCMADLLKVRATSKDYLNIVEVILCSRREALGYVACTSKLGQESVDEPAYLHIPHLSIDIYTSGGQGRTERNDLRKSASSREHQNHLRNRNE